MDSNEEVFPDHGPESEWIELNQEETRCILGLQKYWKTFEKKPDNVALELAWIDLKKEFPRLVDAKWWK